MVYRFGLFEFDADAGELRKDGRPVSIERQPARALARILESRGEVVTRDELRAAVWDPGVNVDFDRGLAYCLSEIRAALGDSASSPLYVQTVPKKGYRFLAPIEQPRPAARRTPWIAAALAALLAVAMWASATRPPSRVVVAVSIFDNETGQAGHDRLVAGMADLVVTRLAQIAPPSLAVIGNQEILRRPRNIRNLKAIKQSVEADYVILGQLQTAGTGLRFITHLIRLSDGTHLKANRIALPDGRVDGLEDAVVAEFERAVREHAFP
jgi:DNA-binding winged helix-turn-helix (wHTH) protein/TolB-like protein